MRVLFIQTLSVEGASQERVYPLGIVTLAGPLQDRGYEISLLDMNLEPDPFGAVKQRLLGFKPDVVSVYHFMVNVPGETEKTCEKGLRFLERIYDLHTRKRNLGTVVLNNIRILPGTPIEAMARTKGVIRPDTDLLYPTYYNPRPFEAFRHRLEALHLARNVFMWQKGRRP